MFFGIFIDDEWVVILNEIEKLLKVYDIFIMNGKLVYIYKCDEILFDMCYVYDLIKIYVVFEWFVVLYEIKSWGLEFIEFERILVEGKVIGIVKILDGFFMVNDLLVLFCWDDFLIKLNL